MKWAKQSQIRLLRQPSFARLPRNDSIKMNFMYSNELLNLITEELAALKDAGKYKLERVLESAQGAQVKVKGQDLLMLAANN